MKNLLNNQLNKVLFISSSEDSTGVLTAEFNQLGSDLVESFPAVKSFSDCYAVLIDIDIPENALRNATYLLKIVNESNKTVFTQTVTVSGNNDSNRAYTLIDS